MRMSPLDLENQKFHKSFMGYRREEVDEFFEKATSDYAAIYAENQDYRNKIAKLEAQLAEYRELKESIERSVTLAQKTADDCLHQARNEARLILETAKQDAEKWLANSRADAELTRKETADAQERKSQFVMEFRLLLETHLRLLDGNGKTKFVETS